MLRAAPFGPPVIGLVGGIGSGKSFVASKFAELGCLISDSDAQVRQLLTRPAIVAELASWWGPGIVQPDDTANRRAIADIVFADAAQRTRLEALLHPRLKYARQQLIDSPAARRAPAVVIDAPLLLEAGLAAECDALVFVDATPAQRLARVAKRGWDAAELARREAAQMPLEHKRARCHFVISSTEQGPAVLPQIEGILSQLPGRSVCNP